MNDLIVNLNANSAQRGAKWVKLRPAEAELATILRNAEGRAVSKSDIMRGLYGILAKRRSENTIIGLAKETRQKLNHLGATIESDVEADGYRLVVAEERA